MKAKIKHIELERSFGTIYDIFVDARRYAVVNNCFVTFPFNGSKYRLNQCVEWNEDVYEKIMNSVGKGEEVLL